MAYVAPRGVGPTAFEASVKKQTQTRRRFYLLGQTLDGMQVWDTRRAIQALRTIAPFEKTDVWLQAEGAMAGNALYASLYEPDIKRLDLHKLPATHREGPIYLNLERFMNMPEAVALAAERSRVVIYQQKADGWAFPTEVIEKLGWDKKNLQVRTLPE